MRLFFVFKCSKLNVDLKNAVKMIFKKRSLVSLISSFELAAVSSPYYRENTFHWE